MALAVPRAGAQTPTIEPRVIAVHGTVEPNLPVWECHVAAATPNPDDPDTIVNDKLVASWNAGIRTNDNKLYAAVASRNGQGPWVWGSEQLIELPSGNCGSKQGIVNYDPLTGNFLVTCRAFTCEPDANDPDAQADLP